MCDKFMSVKERQQAEYLERLKTASAEEKRKIALDNSGFAKAIHNNRSKVTIKFGK